MAPVDAMVREGRARMRAKNKALLGVVAAVAALAVGAGCTGSSDEPTGRDTKAEDAAAQPAQPAKDVDAAMPAAVPPKAAQGGTLTVGTAQVPPSFDPTQAYYGDSVAILKGLVTRSLTQLVDVDGQMVLMPDMATDLGRPNETNTEWTFTLKKGLKYEDGSEVKTADVVYAIERTFATSELPGGPPYNKMFFLDGATYKGPFSDVENYRGVVADGRDITLRMARPFPDMDYYASFPAFTAIPRERDNPSTYGTRPLATGPYKFADYQPGVSLSLVKNRHWEGSTDPGRIQAVDRWTFTFGEDSVALEQALVDDAGRAQTMLSYDNVSPAAYRAIRTKDSARLVTGTSPCTHMWYLDMTRITDLKVRQAIGWAYPYRRVWRAGGEIAGVTRLGGTTILPPGTIGRKSFDPLGNEGTRTDPEESRKLLNAAGHEPGDYEIKFLFATDDEESVHIKDEIVEGLEAGGFKATPIASTTYELRSDRTGYDSQVNVRSTGWCSDWPTGGSVFPSQWSGDLVGRQGMPNPANFDEAYADREQRRILGTLSPEEAAQAWGELDEMIMTRSFPAVVTGYSGTATIHGSRVGGMEDDGVSGMPPFNRMYVIE
ncbi:MAG: ABC transporter substrate-binding protein [Actinomycetota bacterium]|nr:ABC transporter substrate-binding protein [Actinomycetota bacterium]